MPVGNSIRPAKSLQAAKRTSRLPCPLTGNQKAPFFGWTVTPERSSAVLRKRRLPLLFRSGSQRCSRCRFHGLPGVSLCFFTALNAGVIPEAHGTETVCCGWFAVRPGRAARYPAKRTTWAGICGGSEMRIPHVGRSEGEGNHLMKTIRGAAHLLDGASLRSVVQVLKRSRLALAGGSCDGPSGAPSHGQTGRVSGRGCHDRQGIQPDLKGTRTQKLVERELTPRGLH